MADVQGHGTVLAYSASSNFDSTTAIGVVTNISGPNETADSIEMTDFDSDAAEFVPGLKDPGEMTLDVKYHETHSGTLRAIEAHSDTTNDPYFFRITMNDHETAGSRSSWACQGMVTSLGHAIPFDDMVTQSVTIKFTGPSTASFD